VWTHGLGFFPTMLRQNATDQDRGKLRAQSLRSRNAHGHVTRAILCENLHEKFCAPDGSPWSSTGLYTYRKNPPVWTHCLKQSYARIQKKNAAPRDRHNCFVRACPFLREFINSKKARAPWSSTGLSTYLKNPSVWKHCLGKKNYFGDPKSKGIKHKLLLGWKKSRGITP
jgi:hypothetical protein